MPCIETLMPCLKTLMPCLETLITCLEKMMSCLEKMMPCLETLMPCLETLALVFRQNIIFYIIASHAIAKTLSQAVYALGYVVVKICASVVVILSRSGSIEVEYLIFL